MSKGNPQLKSEDEISVKPNVQSFLGLKKNVTNFLDISVFSYLKLNKK